MTVFDLLFIALLLTAIDTLIAAAVAAIRGRGKRAWAILRRLVLCAAAYVAVVYGATALSRQVVPGVGDPQCSDDWCIAVEGVKWTPDNARRICDVTLRIFSRARRVAQRENVAKDVFLVDAQWRRYDPILTGAEVPLNALLQPGESITTGRHFELPANVHGLGLVVERRPMFPICVIIGECGAFHRNKMVRVE